MLIATNSPRFMSSSLESAAADAPNFPQNKQNDIRFLQFNSPLQYSGQYLTFPLEIEDRQSDLELEAVLSFNTVMNCIQISLHGFSLSSDAAILWRKTRLTFF